MPISQSQSCLQRIFRGSILIAVDPSAWRLKRKRM
jgi:hypothetical protein